MGGSNWVGFLAYPRGTLIGGVINSNVFIRYLIDIQITLKYITIITALLSYFATFNLNVFVTVFLHCIDLRM